MGQLYEDKLTKLGKKIPKHLENGYRSKRSTYRKNNYTQYDFDDNLRQILCKLVISKEILDTSISQDYTKCKNII